MSLAEELAAIENGVGIVTSPGGDLLRLGGRDPLVSLDRVVSQEVKSLRDGQGRLALLLAPKGQFRALMVVFRTGDDVLLLAPAGRGAELAALLSGYLKFSRVSIEPVGWGGGLRCVVGPGWEHVVAALGAATESVAGSRCAVAGEPAARILVLGQTLSGIAGVTVATENEAAQARLAEALGDAGAVEVSDAGLELARIATGFPAWGRELTDTVLPPEVGIETLAISYTKGCYVGQETMARIRAYGHLNWRLARVQQLSGSLAAPALPADLLSSDEPRAKGRLTSWACHPAHGGIGLALVHRSVGEDAVLSSGGIGARYAFGVLASKK
jgi:tRNA-modifying protein YgfZ